MEGAELGNILPLAVFLDESEWFARWFAGFGAKVMYWKHFGRVIVQIKRALRKDRRLTADEFHQLRQLSEAIIDYGRMIQTYRRYAGPNVILEITELANRFRETPQTVKDALLLLQDIGCAELSDLEGCWKLQLADALSRLPEGFSLGDAPVHSLDDDTADLGTA